MISARTAELIRQGAATVVDPSAPWVDQVHEASMTGEGMRPIASDPALFESGRRVSTSNLMSWILANIERPGARVPPNLSPEALAHARDLVRRGMEDSALDSYRKGQTVAWKHWMEICFGLTDDPAELFELLEVSAHSIATFVDDSIEAIREQMQRERADLTTGTHAERLAAANMLLEGSPVETRALEERLGYRLTGPHTAAVVWGEPGVDSHLLEQAAEAVLEAVGAPRRLTVIANAATLWVWVPRRAGDVTALDAAVPDGVRIALGRPADHRDGFRASHLDAVEVQRAMVRAGTSRRWATYRDIALARVLDLDRQAADAFLDATLGRLRTADPELRSTALAYLQELCNVSRTAQRLFTHRNTVLGRLRRVDDLLPVPLAEDPVHVAAALELLSWRTD